MCTIWKNEDPKIDFYCSFIFIVLKIMFKAQIPYSSCRFMRSGKASAYFISVKKINLELSEF